MILNEIFVNTKNDKQIVTVAVITYHSSATVLETLDSIVSQSYGPENIELIISDDGSKDNTVQVINGWLAQHQTKFHSVKFFANEVNGGISKNCNVAWKAATSEWIKTIAGDDMLLPNCIEDNTLFLKTMDGPLPAVLFSFMTTFRKRCSNKVDVLGRMPYKSELKFFNLKIDKQLKYLQAHNISAAPTAFINRCKLEMVGYADEQFPLIEDYPLWFNFVRNGYEFKFLPKETVLYRFGESTSRTHQRLVNQNYILQLSDIDRKLIFNTLSKGGGVLKLRKLCWSRMVLFLIDLTNNKNNKFNRLVLALIYLIKPGYLKQKVSKIF